MEDTLCCSSSGKGIEPEMNDLIFKKSKNSIIFPNFEKRSSSNKIFIFILIFIHFFIIIGFCTTIVLRNEMKFVQYENRISSLEILINSLLEEIHETSSLENNSFETNSENNLQNFEILDNDKKPLFRTIFSSNLVDSVESEDDLGTFEPTEQKEWIIGELRTIKDEASRKKRQASIRNRPSSNIPRSNEGVVILDVPYSSSTGQIHGGIKEQASSQNSTTSSEGLRLYESLIATGGQGEPKAPEFLESEGSNLKPYHRTSAAWVDSNRRISEGKTRIEVKSGGHGEGYNEDEYSYPLWYERGLTRNQPYRSRHSSGSMASRHVLSSRRNQHLDSSAEVNPQVIIRNSRVPSTEDFLFPQTRGTTYAYPPLKRIGVGNGQVIARVHQDTDEMIDDSRRSPEEAFSGATHGESSAYGYSRSYKGGITENTINRRGESRFNVQSGESRSRIGNLLPTHLAQDRLKQRKDDIEEFNVVQAEAWAEGPETVAAHFTGDPTNFSLSHRHYEGNGRLRNADGIFTSWNEADWMNNSKMKKYFQFSPTNGVLTIKKKGLYWIYAQIHYLDHHDINGFQIQINNEPFVQCTKMTETVSGGIAKSNTCFTAGIQYLKEGDNLLIRDVEINRFSIIKPEKTFFGLMRIGEFPEKR